MNNCLITNPDKNELNMLRNKVPFLFLFAALHLLIFDTLSAQAPKFIKTIIVDAGHGGTDVGADRKPD